MGVKSARNSVTTDSKGVILIKLRGRQTAETVSAVSNETDVLREKILASGQEVLVLVDITGISISDITSSARVQAKELMNRRTVRTALYGSGKLASIMAYVLRMGRSESVRFFTHEGEARRWLQDGSRPAKNAKPTVSLIAGLTVLTVAALALVGWMVGNDLLMRGPTALRPINPMSAVGLLGVGLGFIFYYFRKLSWLKATGVFGIMLGVSALFLPIGIDYWLFGEKVRALGAHTEIADAAALCFIAIGLSPFTVGTKRTIVRVVQYLLACVLLGLALFNIFGQLYVRDFIYDISANFVMAFNLAVGFLIAGVTLVLIILYRRRGNVLAHVSRLGWLIMLALVGIQGLTFGAWQQADARNKTDSSNAFMEQALEIDQTIEQRRQAYIDTLIGFKGLFAASDNVNQGEFQAYYDSLNLPETYPGIRTLLFVSKVSEKNLDSFVKERRADRSLSPGGIPNFAIVNKTNLPTHYIVTFNATSAPSGTDLGATPSRLEAFEKADATGKAVASGTVDFAATATQAAQKGFFITIPVASKGSSQTIGYVNAVFNHSDFFNKALRDKKWEGINVSVYDSEQSTPLFTQNGTTLPTPFSYTNTFAVADRSWRIEVKARQNYGISATQAGQPLGSLVFGQLFSALMVGVFVIQNRAKRQALNLADRITEDLHRERDAALSNERKSNAILTSIGDAVFAIDTRGRITLFNPAAVQVSGFSEAEAHGQPYDKILKFVLEKDRKPYDHFIKRALDGHITSIMHPTLLIRKDGREVPVADSAAPIRDAKGNIHGVIVVFRDISQERALEKAKGDFVSLASHQLRTPLSAINWFSEMLINGDAGKLTKEQGEYLREIYEGNQRMIELVDSLLNVSRLEVGKLKNDPQPTVMADIARSLMTELQTSIQGKKLEVTSKIQPDLPTVLADPKLLRMVVQNLLSNAVKYTTDKGKVGLVMREATAKDATSAKLRPGHYLYIAVADTGYGIPESQQGKIFQKLFRADNVRKLDVEGTGLGLYIVKEVAEKFGGTVWFQSTEGKGTTFYVLIPFKTHAS